MLSAQEGAQVEALTTQVWPWLGLIVLSAASQAPCSMPYFTQVCLPLQKRTCLLHTQPVHTPEHHPHIAAGIALLHAGAVAVPTAAH